MVLLLNRKTVESLVTMKDAIQVVEEAFLEWYRGTAVAPKRLIITVDDYQGFAYYMPAYLSKKKSLAVKIVTQYERNLKLGLPTIMASILLNDPETGKPLALMDGTYLTATRTGAASAVATKYLARKSSSLVGVIGTGGQARAQLRGLFEVLENIEKIKVYDVFPDRAEKFAKEMADEFNVAVESVKHNRECVKDSDVIVLATTSAVPVLDGTWLKPGAHINSIGVVGPEGRELDDQTIKRAKIVVDTKEGALAETGDLIIPLRNGVISERSIHAELHEIVANVKPGRTSETEITCWKAVGVAFEDAAVAKLAYDEAKKKKVGTEVEL